MTTVHDLSFFAVPEDFAWRDGARRRLAVALSIHESTRVIAVSDFTRREIAGRFPAAAAKVVTSVMGPTTTSPRPRPAPRHAPAWACVARWCSRSARCSAAGACRC